MTIEARRYDFYDGPGRRVLWATIYVRRMAIWYEGPPQKPKRARYEGPRRAMTEGVTR